MSTKLTKGKNGKKGITFFQQHNFRVVQLEFDKWRPLSKMIPNNLLQHPMSAETHERETYKVFPTFFIPKLQFTTSCISAHIHITVFQLVSLQSVCSPLLNTITTYLVSFTFICQRAECITCLPVKSTILSTASQPSYGYSSSKVRWSKGYCIHNTLRCGSCW